MSPEHKAKSKISILIPRKFFSVAIGIQLSCEEKRKQPRSSVRGSTYHRPGLADGHQTREEVFIVQLAENMGVIGHHNGDFFHHLASWPFHSTSCYPSARPDYPRKNPTAAQCQCPHPPEFEGAEYQKSRRKKRKRKKKKKQLLSQACLAIHPQQKTRGGLLSVEEVYTINTFCILNPAAGKFGLGKSSFSFKQK